MRGCVLRLIGDARAVESEGAMRGVVILVLFIVLVLSASVGWVRGENEKENEERER